MLACALFLPYSRALLTFLWYFDDPTVLFLALRHRQRQCHHIVTVEHGERRHLSSKRRYNRSLVISVRICRTIFYLNFIRQGR